MVLSTRGNKPYEEKEKKTMVEIKGFNEALQVAQTVEFYKKIERKSKREIRKQRIAELMAQGIDKMTAEVMADCGI